MGAHPSKEGEERTVDEDALHRKVVDACRQWKIANVERVYLKVLRLIDTGALTAAEHEDVSDVSSESELEESDEDSGDEFSSSEEEGVVEVSDARGNAAGLPDLLEKDLHHHVDKTVEVESSSAASSEEKRGGRRHHGDMATATPHSHQSRLRKASRRVSRASMASAASMASLAATKASMRHVYVTRGEFFDVFGVADFSLDMNGHFVSLPLWIFPIFAASGNANAAEAKEEGKEEGHRSDVPRVSGCDSLNTYSQHLIATAPPLAGALIGSVFNSRLVLRWFTAGTNGLRLHIDG